MGTAATATVAVLRWRSTNSRVALLEVVQGAEDRLSGADGRVERHVVEGVDVAPVDGAVVGTVARGEAQSPTSALGEGQSCSIDLGEIGHRGQGILCPPVDAETGVG